MGGTEVLPAKQNPPYSGYPLSLLPRKHRSEYLSTYIIRMFWPRLLKILQPKPGLKPASNKNLFSTSSLFLFSPHLTRPVCTIRYTKNPAPATPIRQTSVHCLLAALPNNPNNTPTQSSLKIFAQTVAQTIQQKKTRFPSGFPTLLP